MQQNALNHHLTPPPHQGKEKWYQYYLKVMLQGIIVSLPIAILLFLLSLAFKLVFNMLSPISGLLSPKAEEPHWSINILSLLVLMGFFLLVGFLVRNQSGKNYFKRLEDEYLSKIPLYSTVRDMVQQFSGVKKMPFSQVVLADVYNTGVLMTGFVTEEIGNDLYTVFVPTAPNPTNGFVFHIPASRLQFVEVKTESAMRTVVGMGTGSSCLFITEDEKNREVEKPTSPSTPKEATTQSL
jgi:uncharacterized membrane protein